MKQKPKQILEYNPFLSLISKMAGNDCFPVIPFLQKGFFMIKTTSTLPDFPDFHEFYGYTPEKALFFDIETTGLSHKSACVFLIGTIHLENGSWQLTQYLAEHVSEEKQLLETFFADATPYDTLIHFNGSTFDLPFLNAKANAYELTGISLRDVSGKSSRQQFSEDSACQTSAAAESQFSTHISAAEKTSLDLYRTLSVLRHLPGQTSLKQSALEKLAGWQRTDALTGKHMVAMFRSFGKTQDLELLRLMLLHNHDDLVGMTKLLPLAAYRMLADGDFACVRSCSLCFHDAETAPHLEAEISLRLPLPSPLSLSLSCDEFPVSGVLACDMIVKNSTARLSFPGISCELKYFFPDYKNYYYLPLEDQAIHKSVASYIDKEYRVPAKAATCYTRKSGTFYWQPQPFLLPDFRASFDAKAHFFSYNEEFSQHPELLASLIQCCFQRFFS